MISLKFWENKPLEVENPNRLKVFLAAVQSLDWASANSSGSLQKVFEAVDALVEAEASYYYSARKFRIRWSGLLRLAGWLFGTVGTLIPLTAATRHAWFDDWNPWGYVFIALSAAMFAANALFQGTAGHIRLVTTQLQLERLITLTRLEWLKFSSSLSAAALTDDQRNRGHDIIVAYATELYSVIIAETGEWSALMQNQIEQYQKNLREAQGDQRRGG